MGVARPPILLLVFAALCIGAAAQVPQGAQRALKAARATPNTDLVFLAADPEWRPTRISVEQGDLLTLAYGPPPGEAGETPSSMRGARSESRRDEVAVRIGDGPLFLVGRLWSRPAPATGRVMLSVSLAEGAARDRRVRFIVLVRRTPQRRDDGPPRDEVNAATTNTEGSHPSDGTTTTSGNAADGSNRANEAVPTENNQAETNNQAEDNNQAQDNNQADANNQTADNDQTDGGDIVPPNGGNACAPHCETPPGIWPMVIKLVVAVGVVLVLLWSARKVRDWWQDDGESAGVQEDGASSAGQDQTPPLQAPTVAVKPEFGAQEGDVPVDLIKLAGPEMRVETALEPGETGFEGDPPAIEKEEPNG